jgi:hypothetical protein
MKKPRTLKPINETSQKKIITNFPSDNTQMNPVQKLQKRNMALNKDFAQVK